MSVKKSIANVSAFLSAALIVFAATSLMAQTPNLNPSASGDKKNNSEIRVGPAKLMTPEGKEIVQDNTPLPECDALVQEYWKVFNSGNCTRAYEMLGARSRKITSFDEYKKTCDPQNEKDRLYRDLKVKFSTYKVTSCTRNGNDFLPESLVECIEPLAYESVVTLMADSIKWSSESGSITKDALEQKEIAYMRESLASDVLPPEKRTKTTYKYYFSLEDNTWKIEIPHLFWNYGDKSPFIEIAKLIEEGNYVEANAMLKDNPHEKVFDRRYPHLQAAVLEFNRMRNADFPVDIADVKSDIDDGVIIINGSIVNRSAKPVTGVMAKVYYLDRSGDVLMVNEFLLLSTLGVTFPKVTGQVDANGRKPFAIKFYTFPANTDHIWLTVSGYSD